MAPPKLTYCSGNDGANKSLRIDEQSIRLPSRVGTRTVLLLLVGGWMVFWNTEELLMSSLPAGLNETHLRNEQDNNRTAAFFAHVRMNGSSNGSRIENDAGTPQEENNTSSPNDDNAVLLEALQPVTFTACCGEGATRYETVCLTERACDTFGLYPFNSNQQQAFFQKWKPRTTLPIKTRHKQRCKDANDKLTPPTTSWCAVGNNLHEQHPIGCSRYSMGGGSGPYDRVLLFPQGNLAFCGIPKSGITQWLQFLRFTLGAKDYQSLPYFKKDIEWFYLDSLRPQVQQHVWNNWTRAMLIRDPAERLLSAYLDKVHGTGNRLPFGPNVTFAEFVDILAMPNIIKRENEKVYTGLSWYSDPHWRPQAWSCGLSENMPHMDYVGSLDRAAHHAKAILQMVGMWETYGKHYRVSERGRKKGNAAVTWPPPPLETGEVAVGFQQLQVATNEGGGMDTTGHNKNSRTKLEDYYTPELLTKVKELYWMDFALWDAIQEAEKEGIISGRDIARILNPDCGQ